jgi:Protein of unknown function (DUF2637)
MTRFIGWSSVAAVVLVAAIAGWVSYVHAYDVIRAHGEPGMVGRLYPATVDGLIYMSSMVLLDSARRDMRAPAIARWLLSAGIAATLFANVAAGLSHGPLGAAIASWPALALVGSYELLMALIRARSSEATGAPVSARHAAPAAKPAPVVPEVPAGSLEAAKVAYAASVRGGNPLSERQLSDRFGITRPQAKKVRTEVAPESNGHHKEIGELASAR